MSKIAKLDFTTSKMNDADRYKREPKNMRCPPVFNIFFVDIRSVLLKVFGNDIFINNYFFSLVFLGIPFFSEDNSILSLLNCTCAISSKSDSFDDAFSSESAIVVYGDSSVDSESPPRFTYFICDAMSLRHKVSELDRLPHSLGWKRFITSSRYLPRTFSSTLKGLWFIVALEYQLRLRDFFIIGSHLSPHLSSHFYECDVFGMEGILLTSSTSSERWPLLPDIDLVS
ncbi:hypothetical protein M5K25_016146 [Dendrobium thyrsiflorum]|uniref:Uncharacterized protein n=1 Tax=Dendrobium thyrsiflorum TaxID=117978 RepID=A0ABD0URB9_DENTH